MSKFLVAGLAALGLSLSAIPTSAHVTADPAVAQPGSYFRTALRVSHGCSGAPTTAISVTIPEGIHNAKAQAKPGWRVQSEMRSLAQPADLGHGRKGDSVVGAITWNGGNLANDQFDEFGLVLKLPDAPGAQIVLAVTQHCGATQVRWDQIAAAGKDSRDLERPAALIRIAGEPAASAGSIRVQQPFARATPAKVGGAFMVLQNGGAADRLVRAESEIAESVELHTNVKDGETMRMRRVEAIELPAGGEAKLEPGGYHVMLIGLKHPLKEGTHFPLTLVFEKAGSVTVQVPVQKAGTSGGHHHH